MNVLRRLRFWIRWRRLDDGLRDELELHRAKLQHALEEQGLDPEDAARESRRRMGNLALAREDARDVWIGRFLDATRLDVTYAVRGMRKAPGFTLTVVLMLALGIGANTAVFSVLDALMFRALPVRDPGSLVEMVWTYPGDPTMDLFWWRGYERIRDTNSVFSAVIGVALPRDPMSVSTDSIAAVPLHTALVTGTFFKELGIRPALGRTIEPSDDTPANAGVAMISWATWKARFGLDPSVLGRPIAINNTPVAIIGVAPEGFTGVAPGLRTEMWVSVALTPRILPRIEFPSGVGLALMARLRPDASLERATAEMRLLDRPRIDELSTRDPQWRKVAVEVRPASTGLSTLRDQFGAPVTAALSMVFGAVGALLAALGVYGLLAFTIARRTSEIGIRMALGATRGDILGMMFRDALLLTGVGIAAGVPLALWSGRIAASMVPHLGVGWLSAVGLPVVVLSCVALVAATVPARRASRVQPMEALRHS